MYTSIHISYIISEREEKEFVRLSFTLIWAEKGIYRRIDSALHPKAYFSDLSGTWFRVQVNSDIQVSVLLVQLLENYFWWRIRRIRYLTVHTTLKETWKNQIWLYSSLIFLNITTVFYALLVIWSRFMINNIPFFFLKENSVLRLKTFMSF